MIKKRTRPDNQLNAAFEFYNRELNQKLRLLEEEILNLKSQRKAIHNLLIAYKSEILIIRPIDLDDPERYLGVPFSTDNLESRLGDFTTKDGLVTKYIAIRYIRQIVNINNKLSYRRKYLVKYRKSSIPRSVHHEIIRLVFRSITTGIIRGEGFNFKNRLGKLYAVIKPVYERRTLDGDYTYKINLGETKKRKAKLLAEGVKPEELWCKDRFYTLIDEYMDQGHDLLKAKELAKKDPRCGIPYIVYCNEDFNYWINHQVPRYGKIKFINETYKFKPAQDFLRKFQKYAKDKPDIDMIYPTHDHVAERAKRAEKKALKLANIVDYDPTYDF